MRFWIPDPTDAQLLDWWLPLVNAARRALTEEVPWPILVDEWTLAGRFERRPRPDVWVYVHRSSGGRLNVDQTGQSYRAFPKSGGGSHGRFKELPIRHAVWQAGLPRASTGILWNPRPPAPEDLRWDEPAVGNDNRSGQPALYVVRS